MINSERFKLLREVARVAPKEMGAEFNNDATRPVVSFMNLETNTDWAMQLELDNDVFDGEAIMSMLNVMEELGYRPMLMLTPRPGREGSPYNIHQYSVVDCFHTVESNPHMVIAYGESRGEAVAKAFVEVFSIELYEEKTAINDIVE